MRVVYNNLIPLPGFSAIMLFGVIFARKSAEPLSAATINHEAIHKAQAKDCRGYVFFYARHLAQWMKYGYHNAPFEREAYENAANPTYIETRKTGAWKKFAKP